MKGKTALVVDDDPLIRWALARELSSLGLKVAFTASGATAIDELVAARYDLVLLDIHLPDANGLELLADIGTLSPWTRVIVMSADADDENRRRSSEAGASFLEKPFELPVMDGMVRRALDGSPGTRRDLRSPCAIPVLIAVLSPVPGAREEEPAPLAGVARDVGPRGLRVATTFPLEAGQAVRLTFGGADAGEPVPSPVPEDGAAEVLWVVPAHDGFHAGLRYLNPARVS